MDEKKKVTEIEVDILKMSDGAVIKALFGDAPHVGGPGYLEYQQRKVVAKVRAALIEAQKINPGMRLLIKVPGAPVKFPDGPEMPHIPGNS